MIIRSPIEQVRNIGIIAHIDAGKTTITERILFYSGRIHRMGEVHEGTAATDFMEQERERGITIASAAITTTWTDTETDQAVQINLIDTPGHIDFTAEVQRSLRVLDSGIVVFDAVAGVEPQSETVWRQADLYDVPRFCFVNKMDRVGASFERTCTMIAERLGAVPLPIQLPIGAEDKFEGVVDLFNMNALVFTDKLGEKPSVEEIPSDLVKASEIARATMIERIAETDDKLLMMLLEGQEISNQALQKALRRAVIAGELVPVLCGTALKNKGIQPLLDAVVRYLPSPVDVPPVVGLDPQDGSEIVRHATSTEPFAALIFKIVTDPYVGRLAYIRVYSGKLESGSSVYNVAKRRKERIGRMLQIHADKREEVKQIAAGDIVAIIGLKESFTGETLSEQANEILLETIEFPEPVVKLAIEPKTKADQEKLSNGLSKLSEEDPTFQVNYDEQTGQTTIAGMGELHLDVLVSRLKSDFLVQATIGRPQVAYRETITQPARARGQHILQRGGRGQHGDVWLEVEPNEQGAGSLFDEKIVGGAVPREYFKAIEKGVFEAMATGVLAGYPIVDLKVTLVDGSYHDVDSNEMAFKIAASKGLKLAVQNGKPVLLEPLMKVESTVPEEYVGDMMGDFSSRRGEIEGMEPYQTGKLTMVRALVPLSEMFGYAMSIRSITSGRGQFTMQFEKYAQVSQSITEKILNTG